MSGLANKFLKDLGESYMFCEPFTLHTKTWYKKNWLVEKKNKPGIDETEDLISTVHTSEQDVVLTIDVCLSQYLFNVDIISSLQDVVSVLFKRRTVKN